MEGAGADGQDSFFYSPMTLSVFEVLYKLIRFMLFVWYIVAALYLEFGETELPLLEPAGEGLGHLVHHLVHPHPVLGDALLATVPANQKLVKRPIRPLEHAQ